jgi:hypothetical protein
MGGRRGFSLHQNDLDSAGFGRSRGHQNYQNSFDPNANYINGNFDIRNMFEGQVIYELPFGRGHQFLNNNRLLDRQKGSIRRDVDL